VLGPDTPALGERADISDITQKQIAATLAALQGEDYCSAVWRAGQPITEVLVPEIPVAGTLIKGPGCRSGLYQVRPTRKQRDTTLICDWSAQDGVSEIVALFKCSYDFQSLKYLGLF